MLLLPLESLGVIQENPPSVWATYQLLWQAQNPGSIPCFPDLENSAPCSPAMSFQQRLGIYSVIIFGIAAAVSWQALAVDKYGKLLRAYFPDPAYMSFNL